MNSKKKQVKKYIGWVLMLLLVAYLAVMPLMAQSEEEAEGPVASILEGTARMGSVETAIHGGGTLEASHTEEITLPSGVKIEAFLVKNGDTVEAGTPVATVDKVSLMNTILELQDTLDYLRDEIQDASDAKVNASITAPAGGRVKKVYAQAGDSVRDVMLEHGALAILSLDGRMAVRLERDKDLAAGDSLCVTFGDGTEESGRVESCLDGVIIVSLEDKGYEIGEKVTVTTEDGDRVGSGELYVHNAWTATGYSGTIRTVYARENTDVSSGASLFHLTDTEFTGTRDSLAALHREYEQLLQELMQIHESGIIAAPCDGRISGIDKDSPFLLSGETGDWTVILLSDHTECDGTDQDGTTCTAEDHIRGCYYYCTGKADCTAKPQDHKFTCLSLCVSAAAEGECPAFNHKADCIEACTAEKEEGICPATGTHKVSCVESCISSDGSTPCPAGAHKVTCLHRCDKTETCSATLYHYPTCLTFCTGDETCPAENHTDDCYMASLIYYAFAARVDQVGVDALIVYEDPATVYQVKPGPDGWVLVNPQQLKTDLMIAQKTRTVADPSRFHTGDIVLFWTGYQDQNPVKTGEAFYCSADDLPDQPAPTPNPFPEGIPNIGDFGGMPDWSGNGMGAVQQEQFQLFDLTGDVLMTVTELETMTLTIPVDQQDIAKIQPGQTALVEVSALKGQVFEAEVSETGTEGTGNGGSSKFTVELTLPMAENMLAGMNATVRISLYTKMDVLTIPVAALAETKAGTFVYTSLDPETGEPAAPVAVTTGVSDGENVEILSGLQAGDRFFYAYYDTLELDHTAKNEFSFR